MDYRISVMAFSDPHPGTRMGLGQLTPRVFRRRVLRVLALTTLAMLSACSSGPQVLKPRDQVTIDRNYVEYPAGFEFKPVITGLTAPGAISFDSDGTWYVAETGAGGDEPHIFGVRPDFTTFDVYPTSHRIPFSPVQPGFQIYGPVGGILADHKKIYVSHRDSDGKGAVTVFGLDGSHKTIVSDLPAQGDYGVTDLVIYNGRIYFGVGSATNSGVVGPDNIWLKRHPDVCDQSYVPWPLRGLQFRSKNPFGGLFSANSDVAVTTPFERFNESSLATIPRAQNGKPNSAIYSVNPDGGDLKVFAFGFRYPRGLAVTENGVLYITNNDMEMRGLRPLRGGPDVLVRIDEGAFGGFPDYTASLQPVGQDRFQPPLALIAGGGGFPKVVPVLDLEAARDLDGNPISPPKPSWVKAEFLPLSGAAKFEFMPAAGPLGKFRGDAIVALSGDRAPYATSGYELKAPVGYKLVRVSMDTGKVEEFVHNPSFLPASKTPSGKGIERPIDVKVGPDGSMYIVDFGELEVKPSGRERVRPGTGAIYRLVSVETTINTK